MIILVRPQWLRKNFDGITFWPFIIIRHKHLCEDIVFINHERIHLRQQLELLIVFFYLWYVTEFLLRWMASGNRRWAYRNISFEREAYIYEHDIEYLGKRRLWNFLKFIP